MQLTLFNEISTIPREWGRRRKPKFRAAYYAYPPQVCVDTDGTGRNWESGSPVAVMCCGNLTNRVKIPRGPLTKVSRLRLTWEAGGDVGKVLDLVGNPPRHRKGVIFYPRSRNRPDRGKTY